METKKAPIGGKRIGAECEMSNQKHLVPIVTHYPRRRKRIRLIWTPLNAALLILLIAALIFFVIRAMTADPLAQSDLMVSMANSVYRI